MPTPSESGILEIFSCTEISTKRHTIPVMALDWVFSRGTVSTKKYRTKHNNKERRYLSWKLWFSEYIPWRPLRALRFCFDNLCHSTPSSLMASLGPLFPEAWFILQPNSQWWDTRGVRLSQHYEGGFAFLDLFSCMNWYEISKKNPKCQAFSKF